VKYRERRAGAAWSRFARRHRQRTRSLQRQLRSTPANRDGTPRIRRSITPPTPPTPPLLAVKATAGTIQFAVADAVADAADDLRGAAAAVGPSTPRRGFERHIPKGLQRIQVTRLLVHLLAESSALIYMFIAQRIGDDDTRRSKLPVFVLGHLRR